MILELDPLGIVQAFALVLLGMSIAMVGVLIVMAVRVSRDECHKE